MVGEDIPAPAQGKSRATTFPTDRADATLAERHHAMLAPNPRPEVPRATIEELRRAAAATGQLLAVDPPHHERTATGRLIAATVLVRRTVRGRACAFAGTAFLSECRGETPAWRDRPEPTLAACAEAAALREAFDELAGVYTPDEPAERFVARDGELVDLVRAEL